MWLVLETELRKPLTGHEGGNAGHSQEVSYELVAPALDPTNRSMTFTKGACMLPARYCDRVGPPSGSDSAVSLLIGDTNFRVTIRTNEPSAATLCFAVFRSVFVALSTNSLATAPRVDGHGTPATISVARYGPARAPLGSLAVLLASSRMSPRNS